MPLLGDFSPAGDKSVSHRIALFSLLARGKTTVGNYSPGADCQSSLGAIRSLGCAVQSAADKLTITGADGRFTPRAQIDCGNSGTTIRLLMGILSGANGGEYVLDGDQYLRKRPMKRIADPLNIMGAEIFLDGVNCPLTVCGKKLSGITYELPVASAQLKSAILLAALQAEGPTKVIEPVKSRDHTELMLRSFGAEIETKGNTITLRPSFLELPEEFYVPGDPSSAAFFLCAAALIPGSRVTAKGILLNPTRTHFLRVLERMGVRVEIAERSRMPEPWGDITVSYTPNLKATQITADEVPLLVDEIPVLTLVAALAEGRSTFCAVNELRIKETDRLIAVRDELGKMGARIAILEENADSSLLIDGVKQLTAPAAALDSRGDHRMAMTERLALLCAGVEAEIAEEECVSVSYPAFHADLHRLRQQ